MFLPWTSSTRKCFGGLHPGDWDYGFIWLVDRFASYCMSSTRSVFQTLFLLFWIRSWLILVFFELQYPKISTTPKKALMYWNKLFSWHPASLYLSGISFSSSILICVNHSPLTITFINDILHIRKDKSSTMSYHRWIVHLFCFFLTFF